MAKVKITETALRDGHQSLIATRMTTEEMVPVLSMMDEVGYHSVEMWGGATFDACLRFLNEDPWERLRKIRSAFRRTKLQMLLRGQNLLGYKNYSDDVVEKFIEKAISNGIDIVRTFDALNDLRNLETSLRAIKKFGGHAQGTLVYTISPAHTVQTFITLAKELEEMGVDSICLKDMSGILTPYHGYRLIMELKKTVKVPIQLHTHYTGGLGGMTYLKAVEAGVDVIDTALSPFAMGTSQPATETMVAILREHPRETELDLKLLGEISDYLKKVKQKYVKNGILNPKVYDVDTNVLTYQVPGGMLSNLMSQLAAQNALDRYEEVVKEIPQVREDLGYPALVTPMSQMIGTQAVMNVLLGERYKMIPTEIKALVRGEYGKTSVPIKKSIREKIIGVDEVIHCRPADLLPPQLPTLAQAVAPFQIQEEDVLTYALFPQVAEKFFLQRAKK